jgi:predicted RNase H-like HicB family nuclease
MVGAEKGYLCFIEHHPESGTYGGFCATLPVFVAGKVSFEEAQAALEEGVALYLAYLEEEGHPLPGPSSGKAFDLGELEEEVRANLTPVRIGAKRQVG